MNKKIIAFLLLITVMLTLSCCGKGTTFKNADTNAKNESDKNSFDNISTDTNPLSKNWQFKILNKKDIYTTKDIFETNAYTMQIVSCGKLTSQTNNKGKKYFYIEFLVKNSAKVNSFYPSDFSAYADGKECKVVHYDDNELSTKLYSDFSAVGRIYINAPENSKEITLEFKTENGEKAVFLYQTGFSSDYEVKSEEKQLSHKVGDTATWENVYVTMLSCKEKPCQSNKNKKIITINFVTENNSENTVYPEFSCFADGLFCENITDEDYVNYKNDFKDVSLNKGRKINGEIAFSVDKYAENISIVYDYNNNENEGYSIFNYENNSTADFKENNITLNHKIYMPGEMYSDQYCNIELIECGNYEIPEPTTEQLAQLKGKKVVYCDFYIKQNSGLRYLDYTDFSGYADNYYIKPRTDENGKYSLLYENTAHIERMYYVFDEKADLEIEYVTDAENGKSVLFKYKEGTYAVKENFLITKLPNDAIEQGTPLQSRSGLSITLISSGYYNQTLGEAGRYPISENSYLYYADLKITNHTGKNAIPTTNIFVDGFESIPYTNAVFADEGVELAKNVKYIENNTTKTIRYIFEVPNDTATILAYSRLSYNKETKKITYGVYKIKGDVT